MSSSKSLTHLFLKLIKLLLIHPLLSLFIIVNNFFFLLIFVVRKKLKKEAIIILFKMPSIKFRRKEFKNWIQLNRTPLLLLIIHLRTLTWTHLFLKSFHFERSENFIFDPSGELLWICFKLKSLPQPSYDRSQFIRCFI